MGDCPRPFYLPTASFFFGPHIAQLPSSVWAQAAANIGFLSAPHVPRLGVMPAPPYLEQVNLPGSSAPSSHILGVTKREADASVENDDSTRFSATGKRAGEDHAQHAGKRSMPTPAQSSSLTASGSQSLHVIDSEILQQPRQGRGRPRKGPRPLTAEEKRLRNNESVRRSRIKLKAIRMEQDSIFDRMNNEVQALRAEAAELQAQIKEKEEEIRRLRGQCGEEKA